MISVADAKRLIWNTIQPLSPEKVPLAQAYGLVLSEDVRSAVDVPSFDQSSMDGYAFSLEDFQKGRGAGLRIQGVIPAGKPSTVPLSSGEAARIFTGGALPQGADTVVMQEKVRVVEGQLYIEDERLVKGLNVRPRGTEIRAGNLALPTGTYLGPGAIGFLAMVGASEVYVYPKASIGLLVTGDELQPPGQALEYGQVYESSSFTIKSAIKQWGFSSLYVGRVKDNPKVMELNLAGALKYNDIVLLTGGVSVGDFDYVVQVAANLGIETLFHRVAQKPAKPLYFGRLSGAVREKYVLGLPGNPASSLVAFYEYVIPALCALTGRPSGLQVYKVPLQAALYKPSGLTHFLKAYYDGTSVRVLGAQESYRLSSFAQANCLVQVEAHITQLKEGELVEVHMLPL
jgi:molybdopterin molybdotransferase